MTVTWVTILSPTDLGTTTEGTARYSNYRRFLVSTEEKAAVREP